MHTSQDEVLPEYALPLAGYLCSMRTRRRLADEGGVDKDSVALALSTWDEYYTYSDDLSVWRSSERREAWLRAHDQWFGLSVSAAVAWLESIGAGVVRLSEVDQGVVRYRCLQAGVSESDWRTVIVPVQRALQVVCDHRPVGHGYTLPTAVFKGSRHHRTLAVSRRVADAAEQIRIGMLALRHSGVEATVWEGVYGVPTDEVYVLMDGQCRIYAETP